MTDYMSIWKGDIPTSRLLLAPMILERVAWDHELTVADLKSTSRRRAIAIARFDAMTRLYAIINPDGRRRFSLKHIAKIFGMKDHTTVLNGLRRWAAISAERDAKEARVAA